MTRPGQPRVEASLPEVYAALVADRVEAFPALRPHQRHAWHAFLVQLGAMALHQAGRTEPPADAGEWQELLRALTPAWPNGEPWHLVVDDITKPAFMQPPARAQERIADYKSAVNTPDELDMLVTSKNHDLKAAVAAQAGVDDWLFALVTLQTMEGYGGSRNYGISRMPSGYGNRPAFSFTPSVRPGAHVRRDIAALLEYRQAILDEYELSNGGLRLLWIEPWDGTKAEPLLISKLDPLYLEVCRLIRLRFLSGELQAIRAGSLERRIKDAKGLTGDPWAPVSNTTNPRGTPPAFLGARKFDYERVTDGLFSPDWKPPKLLQLTGYDRGAGDTMHLVARGMVRGEGGTAGYHERIIPLRPKVVQVFGRTGGPKELEDLARERIADIGKVQSILRNAIAAFAAHGNNISADNYARANPWANKLGEIVDARFFDDLQTEFEQDTQEERDSTHNRWLHNRNDGVIDHADNILKAAIESLPCPSIHRYRARVQAESIFWGRLRGPNGLPSAFDNPDKENEEWPNSNPLQSTSIPEEPQMPLFP